MAEPDARGTTRLRHLNTRIVLDDLRRASEPARIVEVARRTSLTRPTIASIIDDLRLAGLVEAHEPAPGEGRPAGRFGIARHRLPILAIDLGARRVRAVVQTLDAQARAEVERSVSDAERSDRQALLDAVLELAHHALSVAGIAADDLVATAVATAGVIEPATGAIRRAGELVVLEGVDLAREVAVLTSAPVVVENDANAAAVAVREMPGLERGYLALQWGARVGAGIVIDGVAYRGPRGEAGEIGGVLVRGDDDSRVPLEVAVGAAGIAMRAGVRLDELPELFRRAEARDSRACSVMADAVATLADVLAPVCIAADIRQVVLAGGISRGGDVLSEALRDALRERGVTAAECPLSPHGADSVLRGAVILAEDAAWSRLLADRGLTQPG